MDKSSDKPVKVWRRKNIHLVNKENDIRFRGIFSYRHLRILGWLLLVLAQVGVALSFADSLNKTTSFEGASNVLSFLGSLAAPLFLIAAFSQILVAKNGYRKLIILYAGGAIGIFLAFLFIYLHYVVGILSAIGLGSDAHSTASAIVGLMAKEGFFSFNIFVDLLLCCLLTFFLNYRPKDFFQGKLIYLFRALALLPILYELGSIALKITSSMGVISLSPIVYPLLTTKPPLAFIIFLAVALFVKNRERFFRKKGKTMEEFDSFQDSNVNRAHFCSFLILSIFIAAILDIVLLIVLGAGVLSTVPPELAQQITQDPNATVMTIEMGLNTVISWGFGKTIPMVLVIPIIIFYDYRKTYDNKIVDIIIPAAGVLLIILTTFEGGFLVLRSFLAKKTAEEAAASSSEETSLALLGRQLLSHIRIR